MTDKQMQKLNRAELLEMLLQRTRECDELRAELDGVKSRLESRELAVNEAGSIAEAAIRVSGVFEAAQQAADQYIENVRRQYAEKEAECARMEDETRIECERRIASAERKCRIMEAETERRCADIRLQAERDADRNWEELFAKLDALREENAALRAHIEGSKRKWR